MVTDPRGYALFFFFLPFPLPLLEGVTVETRNFGEERDFAFYPPSLSFFPIRVA